MKNIFPLVKNLGKNSGKLFYITARETPINLLRWAPLIPGDENSISCNVRVKTLRPTDDIGKKPLSVVLILITYPVNQLRRFSSIGVVIYSRPAVRRNSKRKDQHSLEWVLVNLRKKIHINAISKKKLNFMGKDHLFMRNFMGKNPSWEILWEKIFIYEKIYGKK